MRTNPRPVAAVASAGATLGAAPEQEDGGWDAAALEGRQVMTFFSTTIQPTYSLLKMRWHLWLL
jgi:hypothetical protein